MDRVLARLCARTWAVGIAGTWIAKGLFDQGVGDLAFDLCARLWAVGGLSFVFVAGLVLLGGRREAE